MNFNHIFIEFKKKLFSIRPFLRTKTGSRLALIYIALFILMFFAPLFHQYVGTALAGCVAAPYLILIWRKFDPEHVLVPAVFMTVPMLLDMAIYHTGTVVAYFVAAIGLLILFAVSPILRPFDKLQDPMYIYLAALGICVASVAAASLFVLLVSVAAWILYIVAFLILAGIFLAVVLSTTAYTASDGRRQQAKERREEEREERREEREEKYTEFRPRKRDSKIYNLDDDDFIDVE